MLGNGAVTPELKETCSTACTAATTHWMLDEFQDTSQSQWRVIKPFLDDLTDTREEQEGSIFVVGDLKQSVYQWRGGDPALFRSVAGQLHLEERGMATSYRSVQPVLDMVNDICDYAQTAADCGQAALEQWGDYPPHVCAPSLASRTGCARIWQTPRAEETSANDLVCQAMADILGTVKRPAARHGRRRSGQHEKPSPDRPGMADFPRLAGGSMRRRARGAGLPAGENPAVLLPVASFAGGRLYLRTALPFPLHPSHQSGPAGRAWTGTAGTWCWSARDTPPS
ncbi:MAG: UvrD-helicase domain-containing protein [Collinsella sp.]